MKNIRILSIITLCLFLFSCNSETEQNHKKENTHYDLRVENHSKIDIYPVLINQESKQKSDFGVVTVGKSSTKGFGPFRISNKITVIWEEGESTKKYESEIDSSTLFPINTKVTRIVFLYRGKGIWLIQAIDREENVYSKTAPSILK